jgi:hypothetical protein
MAQTAKSFSAEHHLYVARDRSTIETLNARNESVTSEFKNAILVLDIKRVFLHKDSVKFDLSLSSEYQSYFILLKGLIEFHRPKDFKFHFTKEDQSVSIEIGVNEINLLRQFLSDISFWLVKELKFRSDLKKVLAFEARYKAEKELIYRGVLST